MKRKIFAVLLAIMMVFVMLPFDMGKVNAEADIDITKPVIDVDSITRTMPEGKDKVTVGDSVTLSLKVSDDIGMNEVQFYIKSPVTGDVISEYAVYEGDDEETKNGLWTATFNVDDDTENGVWRVVTVAARDASGNEDVYYDSEIYYWMDPRMDLSFLSYEVTSPECPTDLGDDGYSMMLDGEGASKTFGGNYYVKSLTETVTPEVKVRYDDESGSWNTLSPRKYTLKFEKKTGDDTWEEYTGTTFGVDEDGTATYRVGATGKESLHYTGSIDPVEFNVIRKCKVTFDSRGGSSIDPQYVIPGENATKPYNPIRDGASFYGWFDETLENAYDFTDPVKDDITIYAKWSIYFGFNSYNSSIDEESSGGKFSVKVGEQEDEPIYGWIIMNNFDGTEIELEEFPDEGFKFLGWYEGKIRYIYSEGVFTTSIIPKDLSDPDTLLSTETKFSVTPEKYGAICPVFECAEHNWVEKAKKATPREDGYIYRECSVCGKKETIAPLLKVNNIYIKDKKTYTYTGKAYEPEVVVANDEEELSDDCYTVEYYDNVNAGVAEVKVILKGKYYEGKETMFFMIKKADQTISARNITLKKGEKADIDARASGGGILSYKVKSGDAVKVDEDGIVTGFKKGKAVITITAGELPNYNSTTKDINVTVTEAEYTVTFNANGHGKNPEPQKVTEGKKAVRPEDPVVKGFILYGWYTDKKCTNEYNFNTPVKKNITLYAKWVKIVDMYRMYNPNSGEHFYTASSTERNNLINAGWKYEGVAWRAPQLSRTPVYRVYNANAGDHHYTISSAEKDSLVAAGWKYEGIGWYSDDAKTVPIYRVYNPNATTGSHHFTMSKGEVNNLVKAGWKDEGIAWFGR